MGTQDPLVHIEAATLAGGEKNQDRYAYGDGWAFVLDGASSFSETPPVHDGGWYADRLKTSLAAGLATGFGVATPDLVAQAIGDASSAHRESIHGPCPTSTIAMARWDRHTVELYVLGDSFALWCDSDDFSVFTDDRLSWIGQGLRFAYRRRLLNGSGFDEHHRYLLAKLQEEQHHHRNQLNGYWIAGDAPQAAYHARIVKLARIADTRILLCTDGVSANLRRKLLVCRSAQLGMASELLKQYSQEEGDPLGRRWPRSKIHDDKTAIRIDLDLKGRVE